MAYGQDGQHPTDAPYPADRSYPTTPATAWPPADGYQYPMAQYPAEQYPTGQYPTEQYLTGQSPTGQYPAEQYPTGQYPTDPTQQYPAQGYMPQMPQAPGYGQPMAVGYPAGNGPATIALVLGIAAQALFFLTMAVAMADASDMVVGVLALAIPACAIASVVCGGIGMSRASQLMGAGRGKAITGIVLGILAGLAIVGIVMLGMGASTESQDVDSETITQTEGEGDETTDGYRRDGNDEGDGETSKGDSGSTSASGYVPSDGLTEGQLDAMLSGGAIWEGHADDGAIGCKFTFDSADHTYSYWRGDADPAAGTGDRVSGTYETYFDEVAYKYVDDLAGTGDAAREQIARQSETRGEPVHYMILVTTPQTQVIAGTEAPSDDRRPFAWEGTWMTQSRHIGLVNTNSGNSYDMYDSTVPADQRETAATRLHDMTMGTIGKKDDADGQDGSEG